MAVWQKTSGTAVGRGFDAAGFCGLFRAWVTTAALSGGPAWSIIDDQSALGTDPYIVVCDNAAPNFNTSRAKFMRLFLPTGTAGFVFVYYYHWWDSVTHTGSTVIHIGRITTLDAASFAYDFRGGAQGMVIASRIGSTWSRSMMGTWTGDTNLTEAITVNGTLTGATVVENADAGGHLSGYTNMTGVRNTNTDAAGKLYFSLVNTSGTTYRIEVYKDSARTAPNLVAQTSTFTNTSTGAKALTAQNSSGIGGTITLDATATATASIEATFNSVRLGAGEGAQFTVGNYYFIHGFTGNRNLAAYVKVISISGDNLLVDYVSPSKAFASGDVMNPYAFRHWFFSTQPMADVSTVLSTSTFSMPFLTVQDSEILAPGNSGGSRPLAALSALDAINAGDPDDQNLYYVMQPMLYESVTTGGSTEGNRAYGVTDWLWVSSTAGMSQMQDGRTIGGVNYIYAGNYLGTALLIQDTTFTS